MKKIAKIMPFILIYWHLYATPSLTVEPVTDSQQAVQYVYANGFEQLPIKVKVTYDKYDSKQNKQYLNNLQFNVGDYFTSKKMSVSDIGIRCTDNPFVRMHVNTAQSQKGEPIFKTHDITDNMFWLDKTKVDKATTDIWKWQVGYDGEATFCFTTTKNIFKNGVYAKDIAPTTKSYATPINKVKQVTFTPGCVNDGDINCSVSKTFYLQVDNRNQNGNIGALQISANTALDDGTQVLNSGNANENVSVLGTTGNKFDISFIDNKYDGKAKYGIQIKALVDGVTNSATILFAGINKDAADIPMRGNWIYGSYAYYPSSNDPMGIVNDTNALVDCDPENVNNNGDGICLHNAVLAKGINGNANMPTEPDGISLELRILNDRFNLRSSLGNAYAYLDNQNMNAIDEMANQNYASVIYMNYDLSQLDDSASPGSGSYVYIGTDHRDFNPVGKDFRFYIIDQYGNFINTTYQPT